MKELFMMHHLIIAAAFAVAMLAPALALGVGSGVTFGSAVTLPEPKFDGHLAVEKALSLRRSVRDFKDEDLTLEQVSQLLWAAQGITGRRGFRTAPSAGALYPLEVYVVAARVASLAAGVYRYLPHGHQLVKIADGDKREALSAAALGQSWMRKCPVILVFAAVYERTTQKYRDRGIRYVHMEVGHAAQNVHLQAVSLDLGTVVVGAFYDGEVQQALGLPQTEQPLCIMPLGRRNF